MLQQINRLTENIPKQEFVFKQFGVENLIIKTRFGSVIVDNIISDGFIKPYGMLHVEKHNHAVYEVQFILDGTGIMNINGHEIRIHPDSYLVIAPNVYHYHYADTKDPILKCTFLMDLKVLNSQDDFYPKEEGIRLQNALDSITFFSHSDATNHMKIIDSIRDELCNQQVGYYSRLQSFFNILIVEIIRDLVFKKKADYDIPCRSPGDNKSYIIEEFFAKHYRSDVTAEDLADLLHVSVRQMTRIMQEAYQMSFKQKLIETRMESAKDLLKNTELSVKDIAQQVGYISVSNFNLNFKQKNGCTPGEYRCAHQENTNSR